MQSTNPKDYYFHVNSNEEIWVVPSKEFDNDTGYDRHLVEIDPILDQNGFYEQAEQSYYTDMTADDAIVILERLGFVHSDEYSKMVDEYLS